MSNATLDARIRLDSSQFSGGLNRVMRESNAAVNKMTSQFGTLRNVLTGGALGLGGFFAGREAVEKAAEYEKFERMLSLVAGGANAAKLELEELKKAALAPGLDLESAVQATVRLRTMGYTTDEARKHMESLANKVAAFGGGGEEMKGVILALSQISAKGKVTAEEINQIAERLPTVRKDMQEAFGTANTEALQKMNLSAETFINTLLDKWSEAPPVVGGITEEIKKFKQSLDELKSYAGSIIAPIIGELTGAMARFKAAHQGMVRDLDQVFGGGFGRRQDAERFLGDMERKLNDSNTLKGRAGRGPTAEELEIERKRRAEYEESVRKFQAQRDAAMETAKEGADTDQERLDIVNRQLAEITNIKETVDAVNDAYKNQQEISDDLLKNYQRIVNLENERENIQNRINREKAREFQEEVKKEMMSPRERKKKMREDYDRERAEKLVMRRKENKELAEEEKKARKNAFDDAKKGQFWDKDEARRRIREKMAQENKEIFKNSLETLKSIDAILRTLATA